MQLLGSKISLISKSEIRYEGILFTLNPNESTLALAKGKKKLIFSLFTLFLFSYVLLIHFHPFVDLFVFESLSLLLLVYHFMSRLNCVNIVAICCQCVCLELKTAQRTILLLPEMKCLNSSSSAGKTSRISGCANLQHHNRRFLELFHMIQPLCR